MLGARHSVAHLILRSGRAASASWTIDARPERPALRKMSATEWRAPSNDYLSVGSSLSRSQSPKRLIESVVSTITVAGASMIQGARVMYSRP